MVALNLSSSVNELEMKVMAFGVHGTPIIKLILSGVITSSLSRNEIVNDQELSLRL